MLLYPIMEPLKVAVIGTGHLGRHHARIYANMPDVELAGVCDINQRLAKKIARQNNTSYFTDYKSLIGKASAVSIAVPTDLHHKIAMDLLERDIHCLIEKPIANKINQAEEIAALAEKKNLLVQVGHIERFNAAVRAVQPHIKNPRFIECHRMGPFKKRALDVGVVLDLMIHDIDIISYLVGSKIISTEAVGAKVLTDYEDIANARIKFQNKTIANISASRLSVNEMRKIRIFQDDAYISLDYIKKQAVIFKKSGKRITRSNIRIQLKDALEEELRSFVNCIKNKQKPLVSAIEATEALRIALEITSCIKNSS
ncbi:MAG: oxidoreductase [Candidatus Omnitrophica bacterium CG_4_8_14_3_um_filter_43_15]|nr:MAG: oxidoreductase [Candidatus Omnitrophica bacterium CG_4_8_14_3_um_filter_43_15]